MNICIVVLLAILVVTGNAEENKSWSWNGKESLNKDEKLPSDDSYRSESQINVDQTSSINRNINNTDVDAELNDVIETILAKGRQGRNLDGFDDVYSDPNIQSALQEGDDTQARNLIKDKLCALGLMQCDDLYMEGKRPYLSPEDLIYAQPIAIRPVGRPIASVPVRGGPQQHRGPYGPPKPMPISQNGPPRKVGYASGPPSYGQSSKPYFSGPTGSFSGPPGSYPGPPGSFSGPPGSFSGPPGSFSGPPGSFAGQSGSFSSGSFSSSGATYLSKPPGPIYEPDSPYEFDHSGGKLHLDHSSHGSHGPEKPTIVVHAQGGTSTAGGTSAGSSVQNHVHHHYHHGEGDSKTPTVILNNPGPLSVPVPIAHGNSLISGEFSSSGFQSSSSSSGFSPSNSFGYKSQKGINSGFGPVNGISGSGVYGSGSNNGYQSNNGGYASSNSIASVQSPLYTSGVKPVFEGVGSIGNLGNPGPATFGSNTATGFNQNAGSFGSISDNGFKQNAGSFGSNSATGFNQNAGTFGANSATGFNQNSGSFGSNTNGQTEFGQSVSGIYNGNSNSFHSTNPDFYKKELNVNGGIKANGLSSFQSGQNQFTSQQQFNTGENYQGFESARNENIDCVCVPYEQCPAQDIIGRKDDLILPVDPRNLGSEIEAIGDEAVITHGNGTMTVIRVTKDTAEKTEKKSVDETKVDETKIDESKEIKKISKRDVSEKKIDADTEKAKVEPRQAYYGPRPQQQQQFPQGSNQQFQQGPNQQFQQGQNQQFQQGQNQQFQQQQQLQQLQQFQQLQQLQQCGARQVCCRRPHRPPQQHGRQCGTRNAQGINGRIKNPVYVDGDSEFGEYPWQAAILKKDPKESVYVCGGTLIDNQHIITAAHCIKTHNGFDLRVRLGEWDVNHDVEFYPYVERDVISVQIHPEYYAGTLDNDIAIMRLDRPVDLTAAPHISPACLPDKFSDFNGARCWTTGWGKDAFGDYGKYQNILKEVDVPIITDFQCQSQLRNTRLGYNYKLNPGFICAGGEEGKDACKGDGGGPLVCEKAGHWQLVGVVSWGIGCGQVNVPGVYVKVSHYLDWINQVTNRF